MIASALVASSAPMSRLAWAAACFTAARAVMKIGYIFRVMPVIGKFSRRPDGVHAVVGGLRHLQIAEQIVLGAGGDGGGGIGGCHGALSWSGIRRCSAEPITLDRSPDLARCCPAVRLSDRLNIREAM